MRLCVFCGSSTGTNPAYSAAARRLGGLLAGRGIGLVYGGGNIGLMGVVADTVMAAGGNVIGVMPRSLVDREIGHTGISDLRIVQTMHQRKAMMADLSDAFLALPGGYGTFDEFFEAVTWTQLGIHHKACGLLNVAGYYEPLIAMLDRAAADGFVLPQNRPLVLADTDPESLLDRLLRFHPAAAHPLDPATR